jgi:ribonuclease PH
MNIAMTGSGKFVEVQATAEHAPFADEQMAAMISLGRKGIAELWMLQEKALAGNAS